MTTSKEKENFPGEVYAIGLYAVIVMLLMMQPDFGMTFVITCIAITQIFMAGFRFKYLIIVGVAGVVALFIVYNSFSHVQSRIDRFLDPSSGNTYQVDKSLESFKSGGLLGVGPGQGTVKLRLPDAHADFIFAVSGEELGFIFTIILAGIYLFIVLHGFKKIENSEDMFSILACGGLLTMIGLQALIHMGSSLHILPAKGMTLPFISYGGTSLLSVGFTMGAVLSLTRYKARKRIVSKKVHR
ncbi:MAG: FtsW/RodA/SpoVE family cell cycle protein [Bdellovibrionales bacterium]